MSSTEFDTQNELETDFDVKEPRLFNVYLLNDDFSTQDFVVQVLIQFFYKNEAEAEAIMLKVHHEGKGIAGTFTKDIAETKIYLVHQAAKENEFPLKCTMEPS